MKNRYAEFLGACGVQVDEIDHIWWFKYNGFLRPAYLPHKVPEISQSDARRARQKLGGLFARWDSGFSAPQESPWWYVIHSGSYSIDQVSGNTRSKVRRGAKRLETRFVTAQEMHEQGRDVCKKAVARYSNEKFLPRPSDFDERLRAAEKYPDVCEFYGVFRGDVLVGFSENHLQGNAAFWESIWYDPDALKDYSSYLLTHAMLDHYLNECRLSYVSDGCRALYHDTNVQEFLIGKFGFQKQRSSLSVEYAKPIKALVSALLPFDKLIGKVCRHIQSDRIARLRGLILQEQIARECMLESYNE